MIGFTLELLMGLWAAMFTLVGLAKHLDMIDDPWSVVVGRVAGVCMLLSMVILLSVGLAAAISGVS